MQQPQPGAMPPGQPQAPQGAPMPPQGGAPMPPGGGMPNADMIKQNIAQAVSSALTPDELALLANALNPPMVELLKKLFDPMATPVVDGILQVVGPMQGDMGGGEFDEFQEHQDGIGGVPGEMPDENGMTPDMQQKSALGGIYAKG